MSAIPQKVLNKKTGRYVTVGGDTYNKLVKDKKIKPVTIIAKRKKIPKTERKLHHRQSGKVSDTKEIKMEKSSLSIHKGPKTKGWGMDAPKKGAEREALKHTCGKECFLKPDSNGFPICAALRKGKGCKVDCRGIIAAKVRAGIWDYQDVRRAAEELGKKYEC
jgi:hypothetical protein